MDIHRIVLVDNGSRESSRKQLAKLESSLNGLLTTVRLNANTGSAGGYKVGLQHARSFGDCDFIWLLDDDNEPEPDALAVLQSFWTAQVKPGRESLTSLVSYRESRPEYGDLALHRDSSLGSIIKTRNGFLGFNITSIFRFGRILHFRGAPDAPDTRIVATHGSLPFAPYGGMFFHKSLLDTIGYPDDRLYLYCDDLEFSHRIVRSGGDIVLVFDSRITDLEDRAPAQPGDRRHEEVLARLYYKTRNLTYFRRRLVTSECLYTLNKTLFWPLIAVGGAVVSAFWKKRRAEIRIFLAAVRDGLRGNLGKNDSIL